MTGAELIAQLADPGSFEPWDLDVGPRDPLGFAGARPYTEQLHDAASRTGAGEAVVTGRVTVAGHPLALVAGEFGFLAGTQGVGTAERVVRAYERAASQQLPVLALPASGGTRMQEGSVGFLQMVKAAVAVRRFREQGLLAMAYLRHPTIGGVLASWASQAQITFAEPGALIALTGPRVVEVLAGDPLPAECLTAEHLLAHGHLDDVVPLDGLRDRVATVLSVVAGTAPPDRPPDPPEVTGEVAAWAAVEASRSPRHPGLRDLLDAVASDVIPLRGDRHGADDEGCVAALCRLGGTPAVLVGMDRPPGRRGARLGAAGYRKARRAMTLAGELGLPLVTCVDTEGAAMTVEAEEGGIAFEIGRCLATMSALPVPTVSLLLGEGSGGGAIALLPADRVIAAEHAWLSPIAPEGASAILYRTTDRADELADAQAISAGALRRHGIVDWVVREQDVPAALAATLTDIAAMDPAARLQRRARRYRELGIH